MFDVMMKDEGERTKGYCDMLNCSDEVMQLVLVTLLVIVLVMGAVCCWYV